MIRPLPTLLDQEKQVYLKLGLVLAPRRGFTRDPESELAPQRPRFRRYRRLSGLKLCTYPAITCMIAPRDGKNCREDLRASIWSVIS